MDKMYYWSDINEAATISKCGAFRHPKKISSYKWTFLLKRGQAW